MPIRARRESSEAPLTLATAQLDHLPIVAQVLKRLRVADIVDEIVPADPRSHVTAGPCVEALVLAILTGTHTLYMVDELLGQYDLETIMGWRDDDGGEVAARFHDVRLGHALVEVYEHGSAIQAAVTLAAIRAFELELKRLHIDASTVLTYGAYKASHEPEDPEDVLAIPHVTYGHSKDHRPDLKQIMFGLAVTGDGAVPICGRASSGNRADPLETRFAIARLAEVLPDPRGSTLVGDSKFFARETLLLAGQYGFHYVTVMPETVGIREDALAALRKAKASPEGLPLLKEKVSDRDGTVETWRGLSTDLVYDYEAVEECGEKRVTPIPVRCLAVESSALRKQKLETLTRQKEKEREALERASKKLCKRTLTCDQDAEAVAKHVIADKAPRFHKVTPDLCAWNRPVKRGRGRPRKDDPQQYELTWSSSLRIEEDRAAFEAELDRASCFVLATDRAKVGPDALSDADALQLYKEEFKVEGCFKSSKGPLEIAPVFLKTPKRLAGLTLVYIIALTVHALIQRETRARLARERTTIPGNKGPTATPTTAVVFRLMAGLSTIRSGSSRVSVVGMTTEQAKLLRLLGTDLLDRPSLTIQTPSTPRRDQRGYVPPEREAGPKTRSGRPSIRRM
jgi:transposase